MQSLLYSRFRDLYLSSDSINLGNTKISANPDGTLAIEKIVPPGTSGASGTTGSQPTTLGARGPTGPTGASADFKYRGVYTSYNTYMKRDVVTDN